MPKKKKIVEQSPQKFLYIQYSESHEGGEICEGQENDAWPDYETQYNYRDYVHAQLTKPEGRMLWDCWETESISDELYETLQNQNEVYLAVVVYSTGDTFSHTEGMHYILGVYAQYDSAKKRIDESEHDKYKPWDGYFESLTDKKVYSVRLKR